MSTHTTYGMFRSLKSLIGGQVRTDETTAASFTARIEERGEADAWVLRALGATGFGAPEAALGIAAEGGTPEQSR
ncbi:MAG TPA: hypothetical protein VLC55_05660 [Burkholderiales bacterium]|nr:hypothetical protein [Burkholderiales bacterium]